MTDSQWKVKCVQLYDERHYELRAFRKKCVTQGLVTFGREDGMSHYIMRYRDRYVTFLYGKSYDDLILSAVWNTIEYAEETIKKIEGVKHESK